MILCDYHNLYIKFEQRLLLALSTYVSAWIYGVPMIELLFLLGFTLHNIEEAVWLPGWSKHAEKFHQPIGENEFRFTVIIITAFGYLLTFQYLIFSAEFVISKYIYLGFVLMMALNAFFPHLISTILLKRYAPGTITGFMLNLPIGLYIVISKTNTLSDWGYVVPAALVLTVIFLGAIKILFKVSSRLFD